MADTDINPSSLASSTPTAGNAEGTPTPSFKPVPILTNSTKTTSKPAQSAPRVDLEPLYAALKALIPDHWTTYKSAVSRFVLGFLNQDELARSTSHFIAIDPTREHLHNHLLCAIHANILRDAPEGGVASWVSANDKPASVAKPMTGDAAEQRLKTEVMAMPPRFRHRMKLVKDEPRQPLVQAINLSQSARRLPTTTAVHTTSTTAATPLTATTPASSTSGLNKDQEIRRRYTAPVISEARDLPSASALSDRVLPICYEEGLSAGAAPGDMVGELLSTALDFFVKESLTSMLAPTRTNAPVSDTSSLSAASSVDKPPTMNGSTYISSSATSLALPSSQTQPSTQQTTSPHPAAPSATSIRTRAYASTLASESQLAASGSLKRNESGLLPIEVATARTQGHGRGMPGDLRLAWELNNPWLARLMPWFGERILNTLGTEAGDWVDDDVDMVGEGMVHLNGIVNGDSAAALKKAKPLMNGNDIPRKGPVELPQAEPPDDPMLIDETDWGWRGAGKADHAALGSLLDDCLAVGE